MCEHGEAEKKRIYVSKFALCFQGADNLQPRLSFLATAKEREPGFEVEEKVNSLHDDVTATNLILVPF